MKLLPKKRCNIDHYYSYWRFFVYLYRDVLFLHIMVDKDHLQCIWVADVVAYGQSNDRSCHLTKLFVRSINRSIDWSGYRYVLCHRCIMHYWSRISSRSANCVKKTQTDWRQRLPDHVELNFSFAPQNFDVNRGPNSLGLNFSTYMRWANIKDKVPSQKKRKIKMVAAKSEVQFAC